MSPRCRRSWTSAKRKGWPKLAFIGSRGEPHRRDGDAVHAAAGPVHVCPAVLDAYESSDVAGADEAIEYVCAQIFDEIAWLERSQLTRVLN